MSHYAELDNNRSFLINTDMLSFNVSFAHFKPVSKKII